ncbi:membrane hypothetical protein [uncultured Sporomusa sp.]|uniref:RDD domain-containing protein n=1 Tax=uncultured Sporomusa sp. TaxID=307249 RepID=A0A212LY77_9FIRM|nr:RDD family protein [uncultured Sporomusa sp.]SCM82488.1 membrane hypothetical protein [uncultured Sporomusa sp.]
MQEDIQVQHRKPEYAGFWLRLGANLIDGFLFGGVSWVLGKLVQGPLVETALSLAFAIVVIWFNSSEYQGTPGKMCMEIKITDLAGKRISFLRSLGRSCVYYPFLVFQMLGFIYSVAAFSAGNSGETLIGIFIFLMCSIIPLVGIVMIVFTSRKQALHDKFANTLVVKRSH